MDLFSTKPLNYIFLIVFNTLLCVSIVLPYNSMNAMADEIDDELAEVNSSLDAQINQINQISNQIEATTNQINDMQSEIDSLLSQISTSQEKQADKRREISEYAVFMYKNNNVSLLSLLFDSENFTELMRNIDYIKAFSDKSTELLNEEKELESQLQLQTQTISTKKDEQQILLDELNTEQTNMQSQIDELNNRKSELEAEQQRRIEEAERAAREAEEAARAARISSTPSYYDSSSNQGQSSASTFVSGDTSGWQTGIASAYGGSSDAWTPNPSSTATGAICDDYSMGVAIPMAWSGYRSYFGRQVEISYGGMSVIATVNDCGGMGGGSRSLDLQPGVFKAFGFSTCDAWGLRTVSYRFL